MSVPDSGHPAWVKIHIVFRNTVTASTWFQFRIDRSCRIPNSWFVTQEHTSDSAAQCAFCKGTCVLGKVSAVSFFQVRRIIVVESSSWRLLLFPHRVILVIGFRFGVGGRRSRGGLFRKKRQTMFCITARNAHASVLPKRSGVLDLVGGKQNNV